MGLPVAWGMAERPDPRYPLDAVLIHKEEMRLYHVSARLYDIDRGEYRYYLWDDTHTTDCYWYEEDLKDCFNNTSVRIAHSRKPKHLLDGRLYDEEYLTGKVSD